MMGFIDAAISRSRTTLMMMSMVVLCGLLARAALPIANDPHIVLPYFLIGVMHEGISPDDVAASFYHNLGIDPTMEYDTNTGRPITLVRDGGIITKLFS